ncbi:flagellar basal body L-ring protein FlgH [Syntrophotalea acetylenica]|uniref:Flagellar L-ring protein n=1 Tax=Syntrophotalea acetylenica TaxID=29542 RepID=A0A1L3GCV0_SYNAC|nr:flagellar basal body L-ring protein FlgH [Syntrophotalea acetylenica]APG23781.1 flagellar biosynthesis protein FlgH [Syntrophotalea acetylenica]APG44362.1 flagellar biosynthesis protein FlgH [Syntrophotalea acetylenica]
MKFALRHWALLAMLMSMTGCSNARIAEQQGYHRQIAARHVQPEQPAAPGSLWTEGRGSLFRDNKARHVGDIVTVAIYEQASASKEASTATGRSSSMSAGLTNLFGIEGNIANLNRFIDPASLVNTSYQNDFDGSGSTSRKEDLVATLTAQVIEELPNGNLCIAGGKTVTVNNEDQIILLEGIIRPSDINSQNVVNSKHILDAKIAYTGKGVISDKQRPGWMTRVLDHIWPF